jgi:hypothetical protein
VNPLQLATAKAEPEIAELYCEPRAYWHCVEFLSEAPRGLFTFNELTKPEKWQDAISKYLALTGQAEMSPAARQLSRLVEEKRREFRAAQDPAWGNRKVGPQVPEEYERRELRAWQKFYGFKETFLRRYERSIRTGVVKRVKRKEQRICPICGINPLPPRRRKCDPCCRVARRESVRQSKRRRRQQLTATFT